MIPWIVSNGSTIIISLILLMLVILAFKKRKKSGGCGCGGCSNCHLDDTKENDRKKL